MTKTIVIVAVIVIVAIAGYFVFRSDGTPEVTNTPTASEMPMASESISPSVSVSTTLKLPAIKVVNITASNFKFSVPQITVKKGETVKIVLVAQEGMHDWVVDEFNARTTKIQAGQTTEVTFTADKAGTFEYYCSIGTHRAMGMKGNLIVQ